MKKVLSALAIFLLSGFSVSAQRYQIQQPGGSLRLERIGTGKPRNIVFILADDHRYDALGFLKTQSFIETPNLDRMAREGAYLPNAFVNNSLCAPSRATILTGLYSHKHRAIDNNHMMSDSLIYFGQYLQKAGYQTALVGKWHAGADVDGPQRGFDHWVSFKGQGVYLPNKNGLNINGKHVPQKGYITDELTDYAIDYLEHRDKNKPFMLYLSHKGVHADFVPAERDKERAKRKEFKPPYTMDPANVTGQPMWVQNQRNSWHGIEFPYHSDLDVGEYYKRYAETLYSVDASVGRVMDYLKEHDLSGSTLVVYMGDNGFQFGEHGLIDKRTAYEASMRIPMLAYCPDLIKAGTIIKQVVANLDIAPTLLEAGGLKAPSYMDGMSLLPLLQGKDVPWRTGLLYEYYWERNFPQTPTMQAWRSDQYKYIHYYGIWDTDELYDLKADPQESKNLIRDPAYKDVVKKMNTEMFAAMTNSGAMYIPLFNDAGGVQNLRNKNGSKASQFPNDLLKDKP